jgi:two-component system OmpR family sensor kinase
VTADGRKRGAPRHRDVEDVLIRRTARRLGVQAAASVALVVLLVLGAATTVLLRADERGAADLLAATVAVADDVEDPPLDVWLMMRKDDRLDATPGLPAGADDLAALDAVAAGAPTSDAVRHVHGVDYRVLTARRPDGVTVQAVLGLTARQADGARVLVAMVLTGALGLLLAAAVGTWLSRRALHPLSAALALQRRFVADAGHELRTPLTLLTTRAQLLRRRLRRVHDGVDPALPPDARLAETALRDVEDVIADSTRLTAILEDLLLAADPLARRVHVPVDLTELCRCALHAAVPDALERGIDLAGPAADDPPVQVLGSTVALQRALTALIDNALRHARSAVSVGVTQDREALVDVADDGPGVDPALAPRLFTRFAGGPLAATTGRRRYGLGLSLVAEIAAAHGGRVELLDDARSAQSADGSHRTVLRVTLPVDRQQRRPEEPGRAGAPAPSGTTPPHTPRDTPHRGATRPRRR